MNDEIMSDDEHIQAIFSAADDRADVLRDYPKARAKGDRWLSDAIDAAMSHAYAEGRADERREWEAEALKERTLRLMNETGQGEHGSTVKAIEQIWGLPPRRAA